MKFNQTYTLPLLVLAGGFGTRLQSVLGGSPKALAPVNGKPFLYLQVEHWLKQGITSFIFLLHYHADLIVTFLEGEKNKLLRGCKIYYVTEPKPMGTGGAVAYAIKQLDLRGEFLLTNADTWLGLGVSEMMNSPLPAILVVKVKGVGRFGEVVFNDKQLVTTFVEKGRNSDFGWVSAGFSRLSAYFFKDWDGKPFSLEYVIYPQLVEKRVLTAVTIDTDFIDIGIPEDYKRFCGWILSGKTISL